VDVGDQKTTVTCVDEGACLPDSRVALDYGGRYLPTYLPTYVYPPSPWWRHGSGRGGARFLDPMGRFGWRVLRAMHCLPFFPLLLLFFFFCRDIADWLLWVVKHWGRHHFPYRGASVEDPLDEMFLHDLKKECCHLHKARTANERTRHTRHTDPPAAHMWTRVDPQDEQTTQIFSFYERQPGQRTLLHHININQELIFAPLVPPLLPQLSLSFELRHASRGRHDPHDTHTTHTVRPGRVSSTPTCSHSPPPAGPCKPSSHPWPMPPSTTTSCPIYRCTAPFHLSALSALSALSRKLPVLMKPWPRPYAAT
jgi:hypothetical protein